MRHLEFKGAVSLCEHTEMNPDCLSCWDSPPGTLARARDDLTEAIAALAEQVPIIGPPMAARHRRRMREAQAEEAQWIAQRIAQVDPELGARMTRDPRDDPKGDPR